MTKTMRLSIASLVAISMAAASCSESRNEGIPQEVAPVYDYFAGYEDRPVLPESMRPEVEAFMTVMGADASDSSLVAWANSPAVSVFTPDVDSVYASLGCIERDLGNMLSRAAAEGLALPQRRYAAVVWGRPESIVFCDSVMLVALNHYLGESYAGYSHLAPYLRRAKTPGRLPYDMAEAIVAVSIPYVRKEGSTALSRMLYEGALVEACRRLVGGSDAQVLGYGDDEYSELLSREGEMWRMLVSKGLLYSTLPSDASRLVSPAPYTTLLSSRTPGRAGRFIGYRIVRSYMERYPEIPLSELLSPKWYSSDDVLRLSRYVGK